MGDSVIRYVYAVPTGKGSKNRPAGGWKIHEVGGELVRKNPPYTRAVREAWARVRGEAIPRADFRGLNDEDVASLFAGAARGEVHLSGGRYTREPTFWTLNSKGDRSAMQNTPARKPESLEELESEIREALESEMPWPYKTDRRHGHLVPKEALDAPFGTVNLKDPRRGGVHVLWTNGPSKTAVQAVCDRVLSESGLKEVSVHLFRTFNDLGRAAAGDAVRSGKTADADDLDLRDLPKGSPAAKAKVALREAFRKVYPSASIAISALTDFSGKRICAVVSWTGGPSESNAAKALASVPRDHAGFRLIVLLDRGPLPYQAAAIAFTADDAGTDPHLSGLRSTAETFEDAVRETWPDTPYREWYGS